MIYICGYPWFVSIKIMQFTDRFDAVLTGIGGSRIDAVRGSADSGSVRFFLALNSYTSKLMNKYNKRINFISNKVIISFLQSKKSYANQMKHLITLKSKACLNEIHIY